MRAHNSNLEPTSHYSQVDQEELIKLNIEIAHLERQLVDEENELKQKLRKLTFQADEAEAENNILAVKVKEKDQESRLDDLKIRELKRGIPHKTLKPLDNG